MSNGSMNNGGNHKILCKDVQALQKNYDQLYDDVQDQKSANHEFQIDTVRNIENLKTRAQEWSAMAKGWGALYGFLVSLLLCGGTIATVVVLVTNK